MFFISFKKAGFIKAKSSLIKNANSASPTKYHISVQIPPFNGLYDRFRFPFKGTETSGKKRGTALLGAICSKTYPSFLTVKEGSTSHLGLLPSGKKRKTALLGARNRYALGLADHQRSAPDFAGWDRWGTACRLRPPE